jgi:hypothetical protein
MRRTLGLIVLTTTVALAGAREDEKPEPILLPMNTEADEDEPYAESPLQLLFLRTKDGKDAFLSCRRKTAAAAWPKVATSHEDFDYITKKGDIRGVSATTGGYPRYMYFAARDAEGKNYDLFVAVQQDARKAWSAPTFLSKGNTDEDEAHPCLSPDGKALYFSRKTKEGWAQMVMTRPAAKGPQGWGEPREVGFTAGFHHAALTPDGKMMFLQGPLEKERWGLFVSRREGKSWSKPAPLDILNHPEGKTGDRSPSLSRDGSILYFASDRPGGKGGLDLYAIPRAKLNLK